MDALTFGWTIEADINDDTECVFIWGTNPAESDNSLWWQSIRRIGKSDTPLVVIDPRYTKTASCADLWIAPKTGTDCALALGFANVIIAEGLYDRDFVGQWCHGFDEFAAHVARYTPEHVAEFCGVSADDVRTAARWFGRARRRRSCRGAVSTSRDETWRLRIGRFAACARSRATSTSPAPASLPR